MHQVFIYKCQLLISPELPAVKPIDKAQLTLLDLTAVEETMTKCPRSEKLEKQKHL